MDKKKQLVFNLNNFLLSTSHIFDFIQSQYSNTSLQHSKTIAFLSLKIAQKLKLNPEEMSDLCAYCLCHNIALNESKNKDTNYYNLSQRKIKDFPFLLENKDILKYQGERYDGLGVFGLKKDEIPLFSSILYFCQTIDEKYDLSKNDIENRQNIISFAKENTNILFDEKIVDVFLDIAKNIDFWIDIQNENDIVYFIFNNLHDFTIALDFEEVLKITNVLNDILNENSDLIENSKKMCEFYDFDHKDKYIFMITASLCNIGKLLIPLNILEKNEKLNQNEYEQIKAYPYYNKKILVNIMGFNDIALSASRVQEFLDGSGYPFSLEAKDMSLKDRLLITLNIYTALRSDKKYRKAYSHKESINILKKSVNNKKLDLSIVDDIDNVLL